MYDFTTEEEKQETPDQLEEAVGGGVEIDHHIGDPDSGWFEVDVAPVAGSKCEHGVYIAAGDSTARHCGACNPDAYTDRILLATMARHKPTNRVYPAERVMDAAEFLDQHPGARMSRAGEFQPLGETA